MHGDRPRVGIQAKGLLLPRRDPDDTMCLHREGGRGGQGAPDDPGHVMISDRNLDEFELANDFPGQKHPRAAINPAVGVVVDGYPTTIGGKHEWRMQ